MPQVYFFPGKKIICTFSDAILNQLFQFKRERLYGYASIMLNKNP